MRVRRAVGIGDQIVKGTKPGEIPIKQPTKFRLVINLKTAKSLGITCHRRCRGDKVIE